MSNQARVDILLALRTQMQGNAAALSYLDQLERGSTRTAAKIDSDFGDLASKLSTKFSAANIGMDILKGFGIGSGFALMTSGVDYFVGKWKEAEEYTKSIEERSKKIEATFREIAGIRFENFVGGLDPAGQISAREGKLGQLETALAKAEAERAAAIRGLGKAQSLGRGGRLSEFEGEQFRGLGGVLNMGVQDFSDVMSKREMDAQEKILALQKEKLAVQKQIADLRKKEGDAAAKEESEELTKDVKEWAKANAVRLKSEGDIRAAATKQGLEQQERLAKIAALAKKTAASDGLAAAIDKSNEALRDFELQASALERNPFLTDIQKYEQRERILVKENEAIAEQIRLLKQFSADNPGVDPAAVRGQIRGLGERGARNDAEQRAPNLAKMGVGANVKANITEMMNSLRTPAQGVADTVTGTIGSAFASVKENLSGLIRGTEDWSSALENIGATLGGSILEGIINMFVTWIEQRALAGLANMAWSESEGAVDAAAKAPGAALTSISSFGVAAVVGIAAIVAAMAAFGGFQEGGFTGDMDTSAVAGVVHGQEYVMDAATTARLGVGFLDGLRFASSPVAAVASARGAGASSPVMGADKETRHVWVDYRDQAKVEGLERNPRFRTIVRHIGREDRGAQG